MNISTHQSNFNKSIVTALLFNSLSLSEKEQKLQLFVNETDERYDMFCDNINRLLENKDTNNDADTLYLTIDGFSFISSSSVGQQPSCFPVLTVNQHSPNCPDISIFIEIALCRFATYCEFTKNTLKALAKIA